MLKLFILAARLEALTWAGLLLGMVLKYSPLTIEAGVWLLDGSMAGPFWFSLRGAAHCLRAALALVGRASRCAGGGATLVTIPLEALLRRRGLLGAA